MPSSFIHTDWGLFLSVILWNTLGWNNVGSVAGEIKDPQRTYPRGLILAVLLVIISYIWPLAIAVSLETDYDNWSVGYYSDIAGKLSGGLKVYTSAIGLVSALGLFNVRLCTASAALSALAPDIGWSTLGATHPK
jgi:amino acid transporter